MAKLPRWSLVPGAALVAVCGLAAMVAARSPKAPQGGAGNHGDGETGPSCAGSGCNTLALSEAWVAIASVEQAPPKAVGGAIPPGTYVLTESALFSADGSRLGKGAGGSERMTIAFEPRGDGTLLRVVDSNPNCKENRENRLLKFAGTAVTSTRECPPCAADNPAPCENGHTYNYSWSGGELTVIVDFGDGPVHVRKFRPASAAKP